eukprot:CAMPEP_0197256256 /NCGR_PEP_ID=MMETSP1429-20130617/74791_1 /TAXON_ID=49237 /ORGANISM="Chaetoceros  sp., Strain UNC1202" /LENGTH=150 /DNA_ID=CAMNT_0042719771 /DNA_START=80 /DNA_END=532 /DNA_ORIENTATION=+
MTAKKSNQVPQFEVLLKVKQANNSDFSFLQPTHYLYEFYQWWKRLECSRDGGYSRGPDGEKVDAEKKPSLDGVGDDKDMGILSMYGSSSSSSEEENEDEGKGGESSIVEAQRAAIATCSTCEKSDPLSIEELRAQRLKRARMLRHHFASK